MSMPHTQVPLSQEQTDAFNAHIEKSLEATRAAVQAAAPIAQDEYVTGFIAERFVLCAYVEVSAGPPPIMGVHWYVDGVDWNTTTDGDDIAQSLIDEIRPE